MELYGVNVWGRDYFTVNEHGHLQISPKGLGGPQLDLYKIITEQEKQNVRLPVLIRFPDIIRTQMKGLVGCFRQAIKEYGYKGRYQGVFPIKVNQQSYVVSDIIKSGGPYQFGLEVGSKPELLIALALMNPPQRMIICNGFKDKEYIQTALMALKAGLKVFIVVDRLEELSLILKTAQSLKVSPHIGFRIKLNTQGNGKWMSSSGFKSKFGLTASEIVEGIQILKNHKALNTLTLLHFHIGSQISSIHPIKSAIREVTQIMTELYSLGLAIKYLDVGGGLGIDYDGTGTSHSSTNYSTQEYVNDIVYNLQSICDEKKVPHPDIISESGRFLVAHSSLLVFNITDANTVEQPVGITPPLKLEVGPNTHPFIRDLYDIYKGLKKNSFSESFNDLMEKKKDIHQLFIYNVLNLKEVALAENIYKVAASQLKSLTQNQEEEEEIFQSLASELSDVYFSNFSVFQSLPDSWAIGHLFPVMPIHRLKEQPLRRAALMDLTCDSDGKIAKFMNYNLWKKENYLMVHDLKKNQPYYMVVMLTGAYQEILGDMHNLFGDTDAIHISVSSTGTYSVEHHVEGDCVYDVLKYVGYHKKELMEKVHQTAERAVTRGRLTRKEAGTLLKNYNQSLTGYTYLAHRHKKI